MSAFVPKDRVAGYDLARALAFLGMVFINYWALVEDPNACPAWLVAILNNIQGRSAATFVVLAGIGLSLLSRRAYLKHDTAGIAADRAVLLGRASFFFIIGMIHSTVWPADILHFYGIYLAIGAFLLSSPNRRLWALAIIIPVAFSLFMMGTIFLEVMKGHDWSPGLFPVWGVIAFYSSALTFCLYWRKRFQKGPLEWLMRQFPFFSVPLKAKQGMQPRSI